MPIFKVQAMVMTVIQLVVPPDNLSYIVFCPRTKNAVLVDPGYDAGPALDHIARDELKLIAVVNTHYHIDHSGDNRRVREAAGCQLWASAADAMYLQGGADRKLQDGDEIALGDVKLKIILTPGHTPGGLCILVDGRELLTGDTMFIGDCGRTDLPGGSVAQMFDSLNRKISSLPDEVVVYPGHNYGGAQDTLGNQKRTNKTLLARTVQELAAIP